MEDETNDPFEDGIDNVEPSDSDDPEIIEQDDPETDDDELEEDEGTEDETDEAEAEDEAEGQEDEDQPEAEISDDVLVKMADGTTVTLKDLKDSPMLKADHTRKTQELATERESVRADAQRMESITQVFAEHLAKLIPEEPSLALSISDPAAYTTQKAQYDAAIGQVKQLIELGEQPKEVQGKFSKEDEQRFLQNEERLLVEAIPEAATPKGRQKFYEGVSEVASAIGFTAQEIGSMKDHRMFLLAKWAKAGMDADKQRKVAKAKSKKAPPASSGKPGRGAAPSSKKSSALSRLMQDDSIENAVAFLSD